MKVRNVLRNPIGKYAAASAVVTLAVTLTVSLRPAEASPAVKARATAAKAAAVVKADDSRRHTPLSGFRLRLKGGKMDLQMVGGQPVLLGMTGKLGEGSVKVRSHINMGRPDGPQRAHVTVDGVQLAEVLKLAKITFGGSVEAPVSGILVLKWDGMEFDDARRTANGTVDLNLGAGRLNDAAAIRTLAGKFGISNFDDVEFTGGRVKGTVSQGELRLTAVTLDGPLFHLKGAGEIALSGDSLHFDLNSSVAEDLAKRSNVYQLRNVMSFFGKSDIVATNGFVELPAIAITGTARKPEFTLARADTPVAPVPSAPRKQPKLASAFGLFDSGEARD
jgi:uncharacterized protein involved in outer membrane biogenesis